MNHDYEWWVRATVQKSSLDALAVIAALLKAGLAKGVCSANDIPAGVATGSNVRGACFKILSRAGFVKTGAITRSDGTRRHSGLILLWELADQAKAIRFENAISGALLAKQPKQEYQQPLLSM